VDSATAERVAYVRAFNRSYTSALGLLGDEYLHTRWNVSEARVIYELATCGGADAATLRTELGLDSGYLSRILARFEADGLVERTPSPADRRRQSVTLTAAGRKEFAQLNRRSAREVGKVLAAHPEHDQRRLVEAMATITDVLTGHRDGPAVTLRAPEPGDFGWVVARHGALYAREYGWDQSFERLVAGIVAAFDPSTDRAWIAELDHERAGTVLCVHHDDTTAKLRTLLVEPSARGLGLGTRLVDAVIRHARNRGYTTLTLWTNDVLTAARRIYERAGFALEHEHPHRAFGHDLVEQTWSRTLTP